LDSKKYILPLSYDYKQHIPNQSSSNLPQRAHDYIKSKCEASKKKTQRLKEAG
jgi:hypothetical protein